MKPIAVFYHCLFETGSPPEICESALNIVHGQMSQLKSCGLLDACSHLCVGINGGLDSSAIASGIVPVKAHMVLHGLESKAENLTIVEIEKWAPSHPDYYVLYFHAKGCTHPVGDPFRTRWRNCMMRELVENWRECVADLDAGYDSVGCHWMTGVQTPPGQSIWAGNFWWAKAEFLATLPSIYLRDRIKMSGIASAESRYESEVWIGNGPRLPKVRDRVSHGFGGCP